VKLCGETTLDLLCFDDTAVVVGYSDANCCDFYFDRSAAAGAEPLQSES
jgi:hypothetical protein